MKDFAKALHFSIPNPTLSVGIPRVREKRGFQWTAQADHAGRLHYVTVQYIEDHSGRRHVQFILFRSSPHTNRVISREDYKKLAYKLNELAMTFRLVFHDGKYSDEQSHCEASALRPVDKRNAQYLERSVGMPDPLDGRQLAQLKSLVRGLVARKDAVFPLAGDVAYSKKAMVSPDPAALNARSVLEQHGVEFDENAQAARNHILRALKRFVE